MKRILFVCHGNICRSPMAEFVMKNIVTENGRTDDFFIESCATTDEEIGNDVYPPVKRILTEKGVPFARRKARKLISDDYGKFDLIVCMDEENVRGLKRIIPEDPENKVSLLMSHAGRECGISDPWYHGDFERTFGEISTGCLCLFRELKD